MPKNLEMSFFLYYLCTGFSKTQFPLPRTKTGLKSEADKERTGGILDHAYYNHDTINILSIVYTTCIDI